MFDNGLPLFVTKSRKIGLTVEFLPSGTTDSLHSYLTKVVRFYKRTGLLVKMCLMDMEFEVLESKSENALVNCVQLLGSMLNGASGEYSPREIARDRHGPQSQLQEHCRAIWGSYIEASVDPDKTINLDARTAPCIYLEPTGDVQGSIKCFKNLETKNVLRRCTFKILPMPDKVIKRIIKLENEPSELIPNKDCNS
ncbi:hypothetical protein ACHAXN_007099 [Cyclotella atomus]